MKSFKMIGSALIGMACSGLVVSAQNPTKPQPAAGQDAKDVQQRGHAQQGGQHQNLIASCLVHDNQAEIALGQMAQEKSQNGSVKKFANMIVQDHQEFLTKLQKFAPNAGELSRNQSDDLGRPSDGDRNDVNRDKPNSDKPNPNNQDRDRQVDRNSATAQQSTGQTNDASHGAARLQREVAQQCLSDAQAKLSKEDGEEFDKCYMGMQIAMHAGMKSKLAVFSRHASGELKQLIDQGMQTTSAHLEQAESIMKELAGDSDSPRTERRTGERSATSAKPEKR
jgi:predicted outer membrane protein